MRACGIKIHDEQLGRLSFWRLTGRYLATWVSAIIIFIGFFMIGFHPRKQGLHDVIQELFILKIKKYISFCRQADLNFLNYNYSRKYTLGLP